jgi:hypothetical protein
MKLDLSGAELLRHVDLSRIGHDEQTDPQPAGDERSNPRTKGLAPGNDVEPAFGRPLLSPLRNERATVGADPERGLDHFIRGGHLQVEDASGAGEERSEPGDVRVHDVATVLPQMSGDAVGSRGKTLLRGAHGVRVACAPRVSEGGHVVDVDV